MAKKKMTVWKYADWLYESGRITTEEHNELVTLMLELEDESLGLGSVGC
jgi:hypothetical protein